MPVSRIRAQAPGKLFLSGEYAVLQGAPAVACSVGRYVGASFLCGDAAEDPEAARWRRAARETLRRRGLDPAPADRPLEIDSRALYSTGGIKLGFGSSAAVAVAVSGLLLAEQDRRPLAAARLPIADELHRAIQGQGGSGVDVAASLHGGVIAVEDNRVKSLHWPEGLYCEVIFTGRDADTTHAIKRFHEALRGGERAAVKDLCVAAQAAMRAWNRGAEAILSAVREYAAAWRELDRSARLGVFSREHRRLENLARAADCVYKPSGSGGGDCGLAFSTDRESLAALRRSAREAGFLPLEVDLGVEGLRVGRPSDHAHGSSPSPLR
jgi:phosphomevalonate kinase